MVPRTTNAPPFCAAWPQEAVKADPAHEAWRRLFNAIQLVKELFPRVASEFDLPLAQMRLLFELAPIAPVPMTRIAELMACDASNVTGLVDRMESRGLLERRVDDNDRRIKLIAVTREGLALRERICARLSEPPPSIESLSRTEQRALAKALAPLVEPDVSRRT
jgi:DNA-binding MarR family transcriptional regulator